jgi:Macrocin-O-methyltransferase (TylF)
VGGFLDRLIRADLGKRLYGLLPEQKLQRLPDPPVSGIAEGHGGMIRGWGLEYGELRRRVSRDPLYRKARRAAQGRSILSELRRINLFLIIRFYFAELASKDIAELGVYRGGNVFFMATLLKEFYPGAKVYAFDTYEGMPETKRGVDLHTAGDFADASLKEIVHAAKVRGLNNVEFIKGDVRETLATFNAQIALGHIDLDIYEPIAFAQNIMWEHLVPGGYLIYDDATTSSCLGATRAVEDFLVNHGVHSDQIFPHFVFRKSQASENTLPSKSGHQ